VRNAPNTSLNAPINGRRPNHGHRSRLISASRCRIHGTANSSWMQLLRKHRESGLLMPHEYGNTCMALLSPCGSRSERHHALSTTYLNSYRPRFPPTQVARQSITLVTPRDPSNNATYQAVVTAEFPTPGKALVRCFSWQLSSNLKTFQRRQHSELDRSR